MKIIDYYEVKDCYSEDGRGPDTIIGTFTLEEIAKEYAKGKGNYGGNARVEHKKLVICDRIDELEAYEKENLKKKALAKLSKEEREVLGYT